MGRSSSKLARIPQRIREDLKIVGLTRNWREILTSKVLVKPFRTVALRNGVTLFAPQEVALDFLFHEIWIDELYSPEGYEIRDGETVVDIGANIGVFSMYAATRARNVRVKSYEPFPENAGFFRKNQSESCAINVEFHEVAVAGSAGNRTLKIYDSWILHSLAEALSQEEGIRVQCVTLDDVFEDIDTCGLLKVDCEGGEYEILYGASHSTLGKISRVICEFNQVDDSERNGLALKAFLERIGFVVDDFRLLDPKTGLIVAKRKDG